MPLEPIEYVAPTSRSFDGMKGVLFRPFDLGKWFVLGFSAWLAGLLDGGGSGGGGGGGGGGDGSSPSSPEGGAPMEDAFGALIEWVRQNVELVITIGIVVLLVGIAISVVLLWVASRGKFMFLDNVVHNRALVSDPWSRFKPQGNSLFLWKLVFSLIVFGVFLLVGGLTAVGAMAMNESGMIVLPLVIGGLVLLAVGLAAAYIGILLEDFVIPLMYRNALPATEAWRRFLALHQIATGRFVLYALWKILIGLGVAIAVILVGVATCCIGFILMAIPYIGAVVLLPVSVFLRFLGPEFLRQFGSDYDILVPVTDNLPAPA